MLITGIATFNFQSHNNEELSYAKNDQIFILHHYYDKQFKIVCYAQHKQTKQCGYIYIKNFRLKSDDYDHLQHANNKFNPMVLNEVLKKFMEYEKTVAESFRSVEVLEELVAPLKTKSNDQFVSLVDYLRFHKRMLAEIQLHKVCTTSVQLSPAILYLYCQHMDEFTRRTLLFSRNVHEYRLIVNAYSTTKLDVLLNNACKFVGVVDRLMEKNKEMFEFDMHNKALMSVYWGFRKLRCTQKNVIENDPKMDEVEREEHCKVLMQFGGAFPFFWTKCIAHTKHGENIEAYVYILERKLAFCFKRRETDATNNLSSIYYHMNQFSIKYCDEERFENVEYNINRDTILRLQEIGLSLKPVDFQSETNAALKKSYGFSAPNSYNTHTHYLEMKSFRKDENGNEDLLLEFMDLDDFEKFRNVFISLQALECARVNKRLILKFSDSLPMYANMAKKDEDLNNNLMDVVFAERGTAANSVRVSDASPCSSTTSLVSRKGKKGGNKEGGAGTSRDSAKVQRSTKVKEQAYTHKKNNNRQSDSESLHQDRKVPNTNNNKDKENSRLIKQSESEVSLEEEVVKEPSHNYRRIKQSESELDFSEEEKVPERRRQPIEVPTEEHKYIMTRPARQKAVVKKRSAKRNCSEADAVRAKFGVNLRKCSDPTNVKTMNVKQVKVRVENGDDNGKANQWSPVKIKKGYGHNRLSVEELLGPGTSRITVTSRETGTDLGKEVKLKKKIYTVVDGIETNVTTVRSHRNRPENRGNKSNYRAVDADDVVVVAPGEASDDFTRKTKGWVNIWENRLKKNYNFK